MISRNDENIRIKFRDQRDQGIAKCVLDHDREALHPLRARRAQVILVQHFEHAGPGDAGDDGRLGRGAR